MSKKVYVAKEYKEFSSAPSTPLSGFSKIYFKDDNRAYRLDYLGNEQQLGDSNEFLYLTGGTVAGNVFVNGNLSATTIYSGSTNLGDLINAAITGDTIVAGGTNINVSDDGGTPKTYTVNLDSDIVVSTVSADTVTATTIYTSGISGMSPVSIEGTVFDGGNMSVGLDTPAYDTRLTIKGGGTGDTTKSLELQNSDGTTRFQVYDNGNLEAGTNFIWYNTSNLLKVTGSLQATQNLTATTLYSGSTDLSSLFAPADISYKYDKTGGTISGSAEISGNLVVDGDFEVKGTATTLNTETIQAEDNNIVLNFSGNHATAIGGGFTLISGQTDGTSSTISTDSAGYWHFDPGVYSPIISGDTFYSGGTDISNLFGSVRKTVASVNTDGAALSFEVVHNMGIELCSLDVRLVDGTSCEEFEANIVKATGDTTNKFVVETDLPYPDTGVAGSFKAVILG